MDGVLSQEEINALLNDPGANSANTTDELTDVEKDEIGEIANICMGTAATTLFSLVNRKVEISTPVVSYSTWKNIASEYERPCVFIRIAYTEGLDGNNILILKENDVKIITDLMMGGDGTNIEGELGELHLSAICEAMNQMMGSSSTSLSSMLDRKIDISPPTANVIDMTSDIDEGTIDIYKYQKLYHEGIVEEPIPHLLIICDEFAELKQQQEEFMDELISVARIGRSLGVHLILATQKPAGIVNEQIRSNSKFGICLKVQSTEDSTDVINRPDAAYLKRAGQFYMQVGNNEYFTLGLSAYSGLPYMPSDVTKKKINNSLEIISNIGTVLKEVSNSKQVKLDNKGEQLTNIVKYMYKLAKQENIESKQLWMDNIPETIFLENTREKYKIENNKIRRITNE